MVLVDRFFEQLHDSLVASDDRRDCLKLQRMVVCPSLQGRGIGSSALRDALHEARSVPVILGTQEYRNVVFYLRLGFRVIDHRRFGDREAGFETWTLWRPRTATGVSM